MSNQTSKATVLTPPGSTTVNSIQTEPPSVTPSANHSTEKKPSNFQNSSVTPSPHGIPLSILTPVNQTTASNTVLPFTTVPVTGASSANQTQASTQTSLITSLLVNQTTPGGLLTSGFPLVNCDISQLCSNTNAYFWMSISVEAQGDNKTEQDVHNLVSNAFSCHSNAAHGVTGFIHFCQGDRQLQAVRVNCSAKSNIRQTTCDVLLQLSHAVSACELQRAGVSALQQAGDQQIQAKIIGEVERVGQDICGDVEPSSGRLVRCTSTSSLEEICQANNLSKLTCSLIQPNSNPAPQPNTEPCSSEVLRFCDCTAFCNSASQFFAMRININSASFNVNSLKVLLSGLIAARTCNTMSGSVCQDILKFYQNVHLECHGTPQRLYSCMVILEMSGPVNGCALNKLLQQVIDNSSGITSERPLTRMVVCGPPGLAVSTLLSSNLTWVESDLLTSDVCQPDPTLLKCEANESLAILLTDPCPPKPSTTKQSTTQPSNLTNSTTTPTASTPSGSNTTAAQNTATVQKTNASQGTARPNMTMPLTTINSTQSSTAQPVFQTSSPNMTVTASNSTIEQNTTLSNNTTLLTPTENTQLQSTTAPHQNTTEFRTLSSVNSTLQMTTAPTVSKLDTTTMSPNHTAEYNLTTVGTVIHSNNHTIVYHVTTVASRTNHTTVYNVTTVPHITNHTTAYNVTTIRSSPNDTTRYNATSAGTVMHSANHTTKHNVTMVKPSTNDNTTYNVTTVSAFTTSLNDTTLYTATTVPPLTNHTKVYNATTISPSLNGTTAYNVTTPGRFTPSTNHIPEYNVTTPGRFTPSTNHTPEYNITTPSTFTPSTNHTPDYNVTTLGRFTSYTNHTPEYNITTPGRFTPYTNNTPEYNVTSAGTNRKENSTFMTNTFTTSPNHTVVYNVTLAIKNYTTPSNYYTTEYNITTTNNSVNLHNGTIATNTTISTFTASPYHTMNKVTMLEKINTTTVSQDKTATNSITTAPIRETQQNTTVPYKHTTMSTTVKKANETPNNATTTTQQSTADVVTSVVDNTTKPTVAPLNNQTGHHTVSTTSKDNNFTTAATVVGTVINLNQTAGISVNLSSTASSLTTDFNMTTKGPESKLTTTTSTTTTTTIVHDTLPVQTTTTTAKVTSTSSTTTLQTTTITSTTTTNPGSTFTTMAETPTSQTAREEQAKELLNQTEDASQLNSSQVTQFVRELEKLLEGPTVSQAVGQKVVNIISNLMNANSLALSASANRLVHLVDDLGLKLVVTGDRGILSSRSLVLAVRTVDGTNFPITSVDIFNTDNVQLHALRSKRSGSALGSVFLPSSLTTGLSPEQQKKANRVQFTFYTKSSLFQDASLDNKTLVSPVLAASVTNLSISNLSENIQFTIQNINPIHANHAASCVFWDFSRNGGGGGWSSAGCFVVNSTQEDTTCSCNHLTSFAILLDLSREGIIDHQQAQILTFITYIGCGISAIFLALTLLTYLLFEKLLRDIPAKILVQLCLSLLLLNLVFLLDGWLALYPGVGLCISTAFFLHYFLLTSFTWAGLEALHMYLSIVRVFTPYLSRYMLKFSLIGWGLPLLVVIVVISVDKNNYGLVTYGKYTDGSSDDFCWLRNDIAFYVGVVAYFLLIFALCLLVFIVVMVQLSRIKKQNPQNQPPNRGVMTDLRSIAGLIILLGLTWGFSLFAWGPLYLPFVYLFTIFNSLQGFLVFVFHCAVKENVRRQWRTYLCCGSLRLAENSDWSRTATQNNRNMSVTTANPLAPYFTSRSCSVISSGTNSSGSVFWDSGISDGPNSDAHLNEIHRQNLSL
ncbi:uncharacterized threonine-rich GPI-anchored glycoprotein PJ4664.02 isoform X2 [Etheostoma spectabile]|uniref:uncharacterized threonine-rich GPI-anchored glycoprotein PJ4664.02 isoform X2 n=1 Tax=Etheostoma spectabile TaxID=54343 RepID=UPI0013AF06A8|nr:adhesion G-protein coupled receptor G2 isoform X2 [Etheostoma spectabile]